MTLGTEFEATLGNPGEDHVETGVVLLGRRRFYIAIMAVAIAVSAFVLAMVRQPFSGSTPVAAGSQTLSASFLAWIGTSGPADWLLVVVTSVAVIAAFRSLSAIQNQLAANIDAANIARETAAAATNAAAAAYHTAIAAKDEANAARDLAAAAKDLAAATTDGAAAAKEAAGAAQVSAAATQKQLHLAFRPYFELRNAFVEPDGSDGRPILTVGYTIYNASRTPGRVSRFERCHSILAGGAERTTDGGSEVCDTIVPPGRGYRAPIRFELTEDAKQAYIDKTLVIEVVYQVFFTDPFGTEHRQMLRRQLLCGVGDFKRSIPATFDAPMGQMAAYRQSGSSRHRTR